MDNTTNTSNPVESTVFMNWCDATPDEKKQHCAAYKSCADCPYFDRGGVINEKEKL